MQDILYIMLKSNKCLEYTSDAIKEDKLKEAKELIKKNLMEIKKIENEEYLVYIFNEDIQKIFTISDKKNMDMGVECAFSFVTVDELIKQLKEFDYYKFLINSLIKIMIESEE